ncbi:UDP-N-acetylglucosamine transferase subunit ALG13 homolog [Vanessa tameamea]|uniref:UDP-N-acetylglucosamine transferase subunit ALG13 n=1 Tax=Vanessa tameamea TaxID=334116 RepID=A0A8B8IGN3_VANTA|nr:UDP-N-acetylglucosamine transferase subunit ALG13 homolog [Vanessa tameamea]XP_047531156.1 UDP-N-acetylglucosamine transferase subunit ALG13 homolog [Vanessa atalanta]
MQMQYKKCFVTVGTTRFDLLCEFIQSSPVLLVLRKMGCENITVQIGNSDVEPGDFEKDGIKLHLYRFKNSLKADMSNADLIISHAGAGSCLEALDLNKPLLVVVNEELMNNHQLELADQLHVDKHLYYCTCDTLASTLETVDFSWLSPMSKPNPYAFVQYIDSVFKVKDNS